MHVTDISLSCASADLRDKKIHAKRSTLILQITFEFIDGALKKLGTLTNTSNDTDATCTGLSVSSGNSMGQVYLSWLQLLQALDLQQRSF